MGVVGERTKKMQTAVRAAHSTHATSSALAVPGPGSLGLRVGERAACDDERCGRAWNLLCPGCFEVGCRQISWKRLAGVLEQAATRSLARLWTAIGQVASTGTSGIAADVQLAL
ncbi:hypothetical protein J1614_008600 [Plenodomus biglobosus]|nr:hypothetical protein J1614_008600 [Plenodomus biglobosus]